ncbi:response regulator transcription factor [Luteolibacter sp. SL250]|uniref:response regulator transcription factor n=1 Tax=Luteolibacter sp. SL250 TaxID=2995170 RepID=UPI0022703728|nr:response regulator transcription factor [Luteolibacter sp. SL250]WAC20874.1 response regulator transcription factor [Luteolibacter sp. SL250]
MKILLADDDSIMHRILAHQLGREGISVESAYNGREALEMAERSRPDLLILDGMMPELDGFAVLREWKARESLRNIPVVMLTARNREGDVVGALGEGAVDYLTKPFSPAELIARVKRLMCSDGVENP